MKAFLILASGWAVLSSLPLSHVNAAPGDSEWQTVKAVIKEQPRQADAAQRLERMQRLEALYSKAMAADPKNPIRWEATLFRSMQALLAKRSSEAIPEEHRLRLTELLQAEDATLETKALASGLLLMAAPSPFASDEAERQWIDQAVQHLKEHPTPNAKPTDSTFDPETLSMMNHLIQTKLTKFNARLKQSQEGN
jgi:hypothetical protein